MQLPIGFSLNRYYSPTAILSHLHLLTNNDSLIVYLCKSFFYNVNNENGVKMADLHAKGGWLQGSPLDRTEETKSAVLIVKNMMEKTG